MMENCLEIIYFIFASWMKKVITSNGEVLHCLLMVSPEKHRKENPNVSKKGKCCHCQCVPWLCPLPFPSCLGQMIFIQTDLGTDSRNKNACWTWRYTERKGWVLGLIRLIPLKRGELQSI